MLATSAPTSASTSHSTSPTRSVSPSPLPSPAGTRPQASSSSNVSRLSLSVLVILPDPEHIQSSHDNPSYGGGYGAHAPLKPSPLVSRQSASRVPTFGSKSGFVSQSGSNVNGPAGFTGKQGYIDDMAAASRRLSLAPGLGAGPNYPPSHRYRPTTSHLSPTSMTRIELPDPEPTEVSHSPKPLTSLKSKSPSRPSPLPGSNEAPDVPAFGSRSPMRGGGSGHSGAGDDVGSAGGSGGRSRRRPQTAAGPAPQLGPTLAGGGVDGNNRRSMVVPSGLGILGIGRLGGAGKARLGWEGDELVGMLRTSGQELTVIRNPAQLPGILSPQSSASPTFTSFNQQTLSTSRLPLHTAITPVILVPLCDQPSLPSLSLLLQQGTTPTAVCFQQDLLDRAQRAEEEWLPTALSRLETIIKMVNHTRPGARTTNTLAAVASPANYLSPSTSELPIVLAYSANPSINPHTIAACVGVGASGVLKPPYDLETARLVRRMVRAAKEGRVSSVVGLPAVSEGVVSPTADEEDPFRRVVLPPTALSMGGEHAGELALSGAIRYNHNQQQRGGSIKSGTDSRSSSPLSNTSSRAVHRESTIPPRKSSLGGRLSISGTASLIKPTPPRTGLPSSSSSKSLVSPTNHSHNSAYSFPFPPTTTTTTTAHSSSVRPTYDTRRRSVDVSGLDLALKRAQKIFEHQQSSPKSNKSVPHGGARTSFMPSVSSVPRIHIASAVAGSHDIEGPLGERRRSSTSIAFAAPHLQPQPTPFNPPETKETELAELLSSLYLQTQMAIKVQVSVDEYSYLSAPLSPSHRARLVDSISSWNFRPQNSDDGDLFRVACMMFEAILQSEGLAELDVSRDQMNRFLFAVRAIYHAPNPYHNYVHAIDVLQATYVFLATLELVPSFDYIRSWKPRSAPWRPSAGRKRSSAALRGGAAVPAVPGAPSNQGAQDTDGWSIGAKCAQEVVRPQDVLAILIAAIVHDIGHPGLSNAFMKNAQTPLCIVYDDKSVLENMHCVLAVQLLRKHGFGFLLDPSPSDPKLPSKQTLVDPRSFKRILYSSILATDMSLHFTWVQNLQDFGADLEERAWSSEKVDVDVERDEGERIVVAQAIIKCADISNPTRPIDISEYWSCALLREWAVQASLEVDLGLPISVIASADAALQAKGQVNFIDLFCQPLFDAVAEVLPEFQNYARWCSENRFIWFNRLEQSVVSDPILVQPLLVDASRDPRFTTLFPMSLPVALVATLPSLFPGSMSASPAQMTDPSPIPSTSTSTFAFGRSSASLGSQAQAVMSSPQSVHSVFSETSQSEVATRAMRAVYHLNLDSHRNRRHNSSYARSPLKPLFGGRGGSGSGSGNGSGASHGVDLHHYLEVRRASTPEILPSHLAV